MSFYNLARMYTETTGTGTVTLTTAVPGCLTFALAGVASGATVHYGMITYDLATHRPTHAEVGSGTYTLSGLTLTRAAIEDSTNGGSAITLTGLTEVFLCPLASDFDGFGGSSASLPYAEYKRASGTQSINTGTVLTQLVIDTEVTDTSGIATLASDTITMSVTGKFLIGAMISIGGGTWNGKARFAIVTDGNESPQIQPYYPTAAGIIAGDIHMPGTVISLTSGNTVKFTVDNSTGITFSAQLARLWILQVG